MIDIDLELALASYTLRVAARLDSGVTAVMGILAIRPAPQRIFDLAERELIETFAVLIGAILEREHLLAAVKHAEVIEASERLRRALLQSVSHELKTPLTLMQGELETALRDDVCTPAQREMFASQIDEIQRLAKIVNGLALLAKADAGQVTLAREPVRLDELVRESFADAQILAQPATVKVELTACDEVTVRGDRHRLRQLLLNLTENAIKYNQPQGDVTIALSRNNGTAELVISNTGPGIAPEKVARVFDRFFRGDPSHNSAGDGCGLGLSIAQWIVHAHGGSITIMSEQGALTRVTVRLPI